MKKVMAMGLALLCLLLGGCKREVYSFLCVDENGVHPVEIQKGEQLEGDFIVYTQEGAVFRTEGYTLTEPLWGVIADGTERTLMDLYPMAAEALEQGKRVLMVYIDGLGWERFQAALEDGAIPNLAGLTAEKAAAMYPTITPVNYAAMVTGQPPAVSGVTKRGIHTVSCDTIFDHAASLGLESFVSEGDVQILNLSNTCLELSPDLNGSGTGDDEIFDCAMEALDTYPLVFVHFHSVDDASHEYGPQSDQARRALETVDDWCGALFERWDGAVLVAADHGQHENDGSGDAAYAGRSGTHGDFAPSDLFVPLMTN